MLKCGSENRSASPIELSVRMDCRIKSGNDGTGNPSRGADASEVCDHDKKEQQIKGGEAPKGPCQPLPCLAARQRAIADKGA
jgi:hypothetical protein